MGRKKPPVTSGSRGRTSADWVSGPKSKHPDMGSAALTPPRASAMGTTPFATQAALTEPFSVRSFGVAQNAQLAGGASSGPVGDTTSKEVVTVSPGFASGGSMRTAMTCVRSTNDSRSPKSGLHDGTPSARPTPSAAVTRAARERGDRRGAIRTRTSRRRRRWWAAR